MRGQLFSMDFLTAILILTIALAIALHALEFSARISKIEIAKPAFAPLILTTENSCTRYSNGTDNCITQTCQPQTAYRRIIACTDMPCLKEVRVCG